VSTGFLLKRTAQALLGLVLAAAVTLGAIIAFPQPPFAFHL
jgi:hypothetical protein